MLLERDSAKLVSGGGHTDRVVRTHMLHLNLQLLLLGVHMLVLSAVLCTFYAFLLLPLYMLFDLKPQRKEYALDGLGYHLNSILDIFWRQIHVHLLEYFLVKCIPVR